MIYVVTLGFAPAPLFLASLASFHRLKQGGYKYRHIVLDQHYPIAKDINRENIRQLCEVSGTEYLDAGKNLGLHHGFNHVLSHIGLKDEDIVIAYDMDVNPITRGFDMALITALQQADDVVWSSLMFQAVHDQFLKGHPHAKRMLGHIEAWELKAPIMNSISAWKGKFLNATGGLHEPSAFYGGLEVAMWNLMRQRDWNWVFLPGWWEDQETHHLQDPVYRNYKWEHAHDGSWLGDFESYLRAKHPEML